MTVFRCTASGVFPSGLPWSFRQHFDSTATTAAVSASWSAALTGWWTDGTDGMALVYPTGTTLDLSTVAMLVGVPFRETEKLEVPHTFAGTLTTDSLPEQDCVLVSLRGSEVGARNRGRIHLPAVAEDQATAGLLTAGAVGHIRITTNNLYASMRGAGHIPVVYNAKVSKVPTVDPVVQTLKTVASELVDQRLRTQRRRVRKAKAVYA